MKKLEELGISPAPWNKVLDEFGDKESEYQVAVADARFPAGAVTLSGDYCEADANIIAAAPKLYAKAYEIAENLRIHLAVPTQSITLNRAEVEAMAKELEDVLAEAAGDGKTRDDEVAVPVKQPDEIAREDARAEHSEEI